MGNDSSFFSTSLPRDKQVETLRVPPHSVQAEQSVLGGLMIDPDAWDKIADAVHEDDFYRQDHQLIFRAIRKLATKGRPCDAVTLSESLEKSKDLDAVGGLAYLGSLAKDTPTAANIAAYAEIVKERSILRQLIRIGIQMTDLAFQSSDKTSSDLLDSAEQMVFQIAEKQQKKGANFKAINDIIYESVNQVENLFHAGGGITGTSTGFIDLDEMTSGFQAADLIIVAGRPSMGKTAFALSLAENISKSEQGKGVAMFSLEMPAEQLGIRLLSSLSRLDQQLVRTGRMHRNDWPTITQAVAEISHMSLYIDDTPALTPVELRAKARRLQREHGNLGLIVIDYLQLMQSSENEENRTLQISSISRSLKSLARELNIPVIALSQLNRNLENRPNKRPIMSDLRESGSIEQDADLILFVYRDEVYNPENTKNRGVAEIIIAKHRNGPIGKVYLSFMANLARFDNSTVRYNSSDVR